MRGSLSVGVWAGLLAACGLCFDRVDAAIFVTPGDSGVIQFPIQNSPESQDFFEGAGVQASVPLAINLNSVVPPVRSFLDAGETQVFQVNYSVSVGAKDGVYDITLTPTSTTDPAFFLPSVFSKRFSVSLVIDQTPPSVSILDSNGDPLVTSNSGDGSFISLSRKVSISANDATEGGPGSGIVNIFVKGPGFSQDGDGTQFPQGGGQTAVIPLSDRNLENGDYFIKAYDRAGNASDTHLILTASGPTVIIAEQQVGVDYISEWQGQDDKVLYTPANRMTFSLDSNFGSPLQSFELFLDGVSVYSRTYDNETAAVEAYLGDPLAIIPEGTYKFEARNQAGELTSGEIDRYQMSIVVSTAQSTAQIDPTGTQFLTRPAFSVADSGPDAPTAILVYSNATGESVGSASVAQVPSVVPLISPLVPGFYSAVLTDPNGQTQVGFQLQQNFAIIDDVLDHPTSMTQTRYNTDAAAANPVVTLDIDPTDVPATVAGAPVVEHLFYPTGDVVSQVYDLQEGGGSISFLPPDSIAAALHFVPGQTANLNWFDVAQTGFSDSAEPAGPDTGMSVKWSLRTADDLVGLDAAAYVTLGKRSIYYGPPDAPGSALHSLVPHDSELIENPLQLHRYAQIDLNLTRSVVVYRDSPAGGASPKVDALRWLPSMMSLRVQQGPGMVYRATSVGDNETCAVVAPVAGLTCGIAGSNPPLVAGFQPGGEPYLLDPPLIQLGTQGTLSLKFSTNMVVANSVDPNTLAIFEARPGHPFVRVPDQIIDPVAGVVTAFLSQVQLDSVFQIFGTTKEFSGVPLPPSGTYVVEGASNSLTIAWDANGNLPFTPYTVLYATAPSQPLCDDSGALFFSTTTFAPSVTIAGLQPDQGYFVVVCNPAVGNGNACDLTIRAATAGAGAAATHEPDFLQCVAAPESSVSSFGLAADPSGRLWELLNDGQGNSSIGLFDASGVAVASAALANASGNQTWSVAFDSPGNAYAVGGAVGPETAATDVEVVKLSPAGNPISATIFDGGLGLNDLPLDATGTASGIWITGAAQSGGSADFDPGSAGFGVKMSLWHFDYSSGLLSAATSYAGPGGIDLGLSVAPADDGGLWVVGFSSRPETLSPAKLALALWRFDASARLVFGPVLVPSYMKDLDQIGGRLSVSSSVVTAAVARYNGNGNPDLAVTRFSTSDGHILSQTGWHGGSAANDVPAAIAISPAGNLVIGGVSGSNNNDHVALWTYAPDGRFISAQTMNVGGGAKGLAYNSGGLWLAAGQSGAPLLFSGGATLSGAQGFEGGPIDFLPPRTGLVFGAPSFVSGATYISSHTQVSYTSQDDASLSGDGIGVGVAQTLNSIDGQSFEAVSGSFTASVPGLHHVGFYSTDFKGHAELVQISTIVIDMVPPLTVLSVNGVPAASSSTVVASTDSISLVAVDTEAGVAQTLYSLDGSSPILFTSTFTLSVGTHTVVFNSIDRIGNTEVSRSASIISLATASPAGFVISPSTGPVGIPFAITGGGFGTYAGTNTRVKFGETAAGVSVWNDSTISGTVPWMSTGSYAVTVERQSGSTVTITAIGSFELTPLTPSSLAPFSGPIGVPFTIGGPGFGPYAGTLTRVLFDGTTAPISVWNDATISGSVPNVPPGSHAMWIERAASTGGLESSDTAYFTVTAPSVTTVSPSSGPIGVAFTLSGQSFGGYAGTLTQVLFGGTTAAISVWNDTTITGTIPGALTPAVYPVQVARRSVDGGLSLSNTVYFQVTGLALAALSPSTGPIGTPFTLTGAGFGTYAGTNTRVLLGGTTVAVSVWNDTTISGSVPTAAAGSQPLWIERLSGTGLESSNTVYFQVVTPAVSGVSPSSGPIGIAFALSGSGFGSYAGTNTQVLIGGTTAPISVWNDTTITGTIPGSIPTGVQAVVVSRRASDGGVVLSAPINFQVTGQALDSLSPSTGPIGIPFTIHGSQFGTYSGTNTRVRFGAVTAAISVWNDSTITGTIPALPLGAYTVAVERQQGANVALSNYSTFTVTDYNFTGLTPSSGPIGVAFTVTGSGFGPYAGTNTRVLIGGTTAAVSVWNDAQISGTVPPIPAGSQPMWIERLTGGGVQSSDTAYFLVTVPDVSSLVPSSAPIGAPFTLRGTSFGPYAGTNTRVKFSGVAAPISVWNDTLISGTVPGSLSTGVAVIVVERASGSGVVQSAPGDFLVLAPTVSSITPASGTAGTAVTLSGFGFGPYAGTATKLLVNGSTVAVAVWNDSTIRWTVPSGFGNGTYPVVVIRSPAGGTIQSDPVNFTVGTGVSALFAAAPLASQPDVRFVGDLNLPASEGGRIQTPAQAAVEVPPGALDQDTEITLAREKEAFKADRKAALSRDGLGTVGEAIQFGPEGTRFSQPVLIELPYDPELVPPGKLGEVAINYYDPAAKTWTPLLTQADSRRHVLSARTDHFSLYQPLGRGIRVAASGELRFADVYVFPNPARGARSVTIRAQPGGADTVSVRVYDLVGRKVYESSNFSVSGGNYDNVWDLGGVASGVYTFVVTARKAGQADIHAEGRIGVVK